jgi:DNA-binding NarL/FixJ family response regulator
MKKHIMLIEGDHHSYDIFMEALQSIQLSCKVTCAKDYEHALQMLPYLVPDYVFMHIDMSGNAMECIRRIRNASELSDVKVIAYDDHLTTKMIRDTLKEGADYCIDQPTNYADMNFLFRDLLN